MDWAVFLVAAAAILAGALGVVTSRNPVHAALSLVLTLFGIAVLFVAQQAHFLAVVQAENLEVEPLAGQRQAAVGLGLAGLACLLLPIAFGRWEWLSGQPS